MRKSKETLLLKFSSAAAVYLNHQVIRSSRSFCRRVSQLIETSKRKYIICQVVRVEYRLAIVSKLCYSDVTKSTYKYDL